MKLFHWKTLILAGLLILTWDVRCFGQPEPVSNALYQINQLFDRGQLTACIRESKLLLQEDLNRQERIETLRLLALSLHTIGELDSAEKATLLLLRQKPDYPKFPYPDPLSFRQFLSHFEIRPRWSIAIASGAGFSESVFQDFFTLHTGKTEATIQPGFWLQTSLAYGIYKHWSLEIGGAYESHRFGQNYVTSATSMGTANEQQNMFNYHFGINYLVFPLQRLKIKLGARIERKIFQQADLFLSVNSSNPNQSTVNDYLDINPFRKNFWSGGLSLSLQYDFGGFAFESGVMGNATFQTLNNSDDPYKFAGNLQQYPFLYLDSPFQQRLFRVFIGIAIPLSHTAKNTNQ